MANGKWFYGQLIRSIYCRPDEGGSGELIMNAHGIQQNASKLGERRERERDREGSDRSGKEREERRR